MKLKAEDLTIELTEKVNSIDGIYGNEITGKDVLKYPERFIRTHRHLFVNPKRVEFVLSSRIKEVVKAKGNKTKLVTSKIDGQTFGCVISS